jgi:regulator of protease activity HflC (stomatin/prohibitin superfamily)
MRALTLSMFVSILALGLSGCNKAESPEKVQHDVGKATDSAAEKDAQAADRLARTEASANNDVATAEARADKKTTDAAGDAIISQAEGDHKVALAQCEALSGHAQQDCRKQADDQLDEVKAKVKQLKKDTD